MHNCIFAPWGNVKIDGEECTFLYPQGGRYCTPDVDILAPLRLTSLAPRGVHSDTPEVDISVWQRLALFPVEINIVVVNRRSVQGAECN